MAATVVEEEKADPLHGVKGSYLGLFTIKVTASLLDSTPATLAKWRCIGVGPPYVKLGPKKIRYREVDLRRWIDSQVVEVG